MLATTTSQILKTPFASVLSFGDSVSDNGFIDGHGFMRYTNTWTWVEYVAQMLGIPNENWAFGGAMSDRRNQYHQSEASWGGLAWQVDEHLGTSPENLSSALVTVFCGSNDYWGGQRDGEAVAENVRRAIESLVQAGARNLIYRETTAVILGPGFFSEDCAGDAEGWRKLVNDTNLATRRDLKKYFGEKYENFNLLYLDTDHVMEKSRIMSCQQISR